MADKEVLQSNGGEMESVLVRYYLTRGWTASQPSKSPDTLCCVPSSELLITLRCRDPFESLIPFGL